MRSDQVMIEALAYELPAISVATADLEAALAPIYARLGVAPGWVERLTGVVERRFWPRDQRPWQGAVVAAERALAQAGLARERIGVVVNTAVSRDVLEPSTASTIHGALGLGPGCLNFDLGNACLGFLSGLTVVDGLIRAGTVDAGLVVAGEGSRQVVESTLDRMLRAPPDLATFSSQVATLTLGSAAVAAVLTRPDLSRTGHRYVGGVARAATDCNHLCRGDQDGMVTDGPRLLEAGVSLAIRTWQDALDRFGWRADGLGAYAMHQVGAGHHAAVIQALGLVAERAPALYPTLGNVGAAGVPLALAAAVEREPLRAGQPLALLGIGSGLNCAIHEVIW